MSETTEGTIRTVFDPDPGTRQPWNVYMEDDDRRYSTFEKEIADVAQANIGNWGTLTFSVTQSKSKKPGDDRIFTNYTFEGFTPIKTLDRELTDRGPNGAAPNYRQATHPDEQASIHRAVALQRAHEWLPYLENPSMKDIEALFEQELKILEGK